MSSATFPTFPGTKVDIVRTPRWSTKILTSASGREQRVAFFDAPLYEYELSIEVLRQGNVNSSKTWTELSTLVDFYNARKGAFDTFYFVDPADGTTRTVRFAEDKLPTQRLMITLWQATKVKLVEVR